MLHWCRACRAVIRRPGTALHGIAGGLAPDRMGEPGHWHRGGWGDMAMQVSTYEADSPRAGEQQRVWRTELTPLNFLERSVQVFRERTAVIDGDRSYSYAELGQRVSRLASALRADGVAPGDRVA